jgi:peptidyl-prolyl cis-trans isomerase D
MKNLKKKFGPVVVVFISAMVALVFVFTDFGSSLNNMGGAGGPGVVARIDNEAISLAEFERTFQQRLRAFEQQFQQPLSQEQIQMMGLRRQILESLIQRKLLIRKAEEIGIPVSDRALGSQVAEMEAFQHPDTKTFDMQQYEEVLRANGWSRGQFERLLKQDMLVQEFQELIASQVGQVSDREIRDLYLRENSQATLHSANISIEELRSEKKVSDSEIDAFLSKEENRRRAQNWFETHRDDYDQKAQVKARHILIRKGEDPEASQKKVEELASKANPENFQTLANKFTEDPSGQKKGGDLGWFEKGRMTPAFEEAAFSAEPGSVLGPVETPYGWHLIFVEDKRPEVKKTFDQVAAQVAEKVIRLDLTDTIRKEALEMAESFEKEMQSLIDSSKKSPNLRKLEKSTGVQVKTHESFTTARGVALPVEKQALVKGVFGREAELRKKPKIYETAGAIVVVVASEVDLPEDRVLDTLKEKDPETWETFRSKAQSQKESRFFNVWLESLEKEAEVKRYPEVAGIELGSGFPQGLGGL